MSDSVVEVLCYWNGAILRTETDLRYIGNNVEIEPLDMTIGTTFVELLNMIYGIIGVDRHHQLVLKCRHPAGMNKFQPLVIRNDRTVQRMLAVPSKYGMSSVELFIEYAPSHSNLSNEMGHLTQLLAGDSDDQRMTNNENIDDENERDEEHERDDEYNGGNDAIDTDSINLADDNENCDQRETIDLMMVQQVVESESRRYVNLEVGDRSNDPEVEIELEETSPCASQHGTQVNISNDNREATPSPISFHMPPTPQFLNMDGAINCVVSDWTPWKAPWCEDGELSIGKVFASKADLQHAVKMYSIKSHQEFNVYRSNTSLLVLKCKKAPDCQWRLRAMAVKDTGMFRITKYEGPHTCVNPCINQDHSQLDSSFVSAYIETLVKAQMTVTVAAIQAVVAKQFGYQISYQKAMKAKKKAMTQLFGDWYKSYAELPRFFLALEQSNPGCVVYSKSIPGNKPNEDIFQRVFWAFSASIQGFPHCRPFLSIDGTHLYGKYKGTLMIAMGCDGNNKLFPLAFAIIEGENTDSWSWFLACIRVGVTQRKGLCLISDRHPGIIAAVNDNYSGWTEPDAYHRFCMRHLASNFNTRFKDKTLKDLMCRAAMESKVKKFLTHMDTIGRINVAARTWLEQIPLDKWALSHDGGRRYGIMTTNMSEVFNGVLKSARSLPITALVQLTFYRVNSYFTIRREHGASRLASGEEFTPYIDAKIKAKVVKAGSHEVVLYDHVQGRFHVKTRRSVGSSSRKPRTYHVNLRPGSCTCNKTLLLGFPCSHILAACHYRSVDFRQFVQSYYTTRAYLSTWAPLFYPIFDELEWPQYNGAIIVPSESMKRVSSGRPKSSRLHNEMDAREANTPQTCGLCKQPGHNRRSCPNKE